MREIDDTTLGNVASGLYLRADLMLLNIASVLYGFYDGSAGTIAISGVNYVGAGSLIKVEPMLAGVELSASPLRVTLRSVPETGLTPDVLATVDDYAYKHAPVAFYRAYFSRDTGAVVNMYRLWRGEVDRVTSRWQVGGEKVLLGIFEPRSIDHSRTGYRMRSDVDQRLIDPDDKFFEHAATVGTAKLPYGRVADAAGGPYPGGGPTGGSR